jgi:23S rRNA pseudouridine2605 synthase
MTKKTKKTSKADDLKAESSQSASEINPAAKIEDSIGAGTGGGAEIAIEAEAGTGTETAIRPEIEDELEAAAAETEAAIEGAENKAEAGAGHEGEPEFNPELHPPAKLERLQKILAKAGVASRRKAEELIEQGRVQVNGKVVTQLGTKADAGRDHIRVDGKLLQGAERLRYFVLNKPKGFVTTVKDPEGRPTVMQFFEKMKERLYPVGRLDYMSEGLLLVTNDGELANRLTRAAAGVEKTYLVKVSGQPSENELDILRGGVAIERGERGSAPVRTSPARIRQVRQGDNPWYEVVLIEGRNRELRKMFEEIGHFVEKIRRVGYGPLVLDQEPGHLRELEPEEVERLRKAAAGTLRTPKSKEVRRRNAMDAAGLPTVAPRPSPRRPAKPFVARPFDARSAASPRPGDFRPKKSFATEKPPRPFRSASESRPAGKDRRGGDFSRAGNAGPVRLGSARPTGSHATARPARPTEDRRSPARPFAPRPSAGRTSPSRPAASRPFHGSGGLSRPFTTSSGKPRVGGARPSSKTGGLGKPSKPAARSYGAGRAQRPFESKPGGPAKRPFRREEGDGSFAPRPPRLREGSSSRPAGPRASAPRPAGKPGWKPKSSFGSPGKPASGARSNPGAPAERPSSVAWKSRAPAERSSSVGRKPSGFSKSGYKVKPGGRRPGGAPGGKRRG